MNAHGDNDAEIFGDYDFEYFEDEGYPIIKDDEFGWNLYFVAKYYLIATITAFSMLLGGALATIIWPVAK